LDRQKFHEAFERIILGEQLETGIVHSQNSTVNEQHSVAYKQRSIGTLGEKTLHAILKLYFEPDDSKHEVKVGAYVADIHNDNGIIEIQTRAFNKLRNKLTEFLKTSPVTVVYPLPKTKWLLWIDEATGDTTKKRKSPKQGRIFDAIPELYRIKPLLSQPNLSICIPFIDMEEYRYLNGWSDDKKRGSTRYNRIPVNIVEEVWLRTADDYLKFIPDILPHRFNSKEYMKAASVNQKISQTSLNILYHIGAVKRVGKQGNMHIYERAVLNSIL